MQSSFLRKQGSHVFALDSRIRGNDIRELTLTGFNNSGVIVLFSEYLSEEWVPALGCTEPASIALAAATAASQLTGDVKSVRLTIDTRMYKNCYAVGIPHSGHMTGIRWAAAIGSFLPEPSLGLECFHYINQDVLASANALLSGNKISVDVDPKKDELYVDCRIVASDGNARSVIKTDHTNVVLIEKDGKAVMKKDDKVRGSKKIQIRKKVAEMNLGEMIRLARSIKKNDRSLLEEGTAMNMAMAKHGMTLFPVNFIERTGHDSLAAIATHVCAGVYARMWGEELPVMSLAGSGNKGIVASVPMALYGAQNGKSSEQIEEALALACLVTSATTYHLGTLSAVCGCSNAAGIGLAVGLVFLEGGDTKEMSLAINNMVGNVTGMICDGAKIGCALKTMTSVDAAFRAASLAKSGIGIPATDGIVGSSGRISLENIGRISTRGMISADKEILAIMQEKLRA